MIKYFCKQCGKELTRIQILKHQKFCSKGCATSFRCAAHDPDVFEMQNKHILYYIIGLLITDGNISSNNKKITLSLTDKDLIETLAPFFIDREKRRIYVSSPKMKNASPAYTLINTNSQSIQKLNGMGITSNKTYNTVMPQIPTPYIYDFLRGVLDGDGCIYVSSIVKGKKYFAISVTTGSQKFAQDLTNTLTTMGYSPTIVIDSRRREQKHKTYYVKLNKQQEIQRFLQEIYRNANGVMIKQKYNKYYDKNIV